jgi:hypothetical protein
LPLNTSEEHASFKGTVSLSPSTLMLVLEEVVERLHAQGFRKQVLTVGHGGALWVGTFVKHVNRRFGDVVVVDAHRGLLRSGKKRCARAGWRAGARCTAGRSRAPWRSIWRRGA